MEGFKQQKPACLSTTYVVNLLDRLRVKGGILYRKLIGQKDSDLPSLGAQTLFRMKTKIGCALVAPLMDPFKDLSGASRLDMVEHS